MKKSQTIATTLIAVTVTALLGGCANSNRPVTTSQYPSTSSTSASAYGVIDSIQMVPSSSGSGSAVGTVAGGVVGGLLGNQVGSGRGRTAATVAGAVGGAMVGNEMGQSNQAQASLYQIGIRLDDGSYQTIQQDTISDLRVGSRVHVDNGRVYRY